MCERKSAFPTCERLVFRKFEANTDADFVFELMNSPGWKSFIGDKNIADREAARHHIKKALLPLYAKEYTKEYTKEYANKLGLSPGLGLYALFEKQTQAPVGMCGLLKRDYLPAVDLGFALLSCFEGKGYMLEATEAALAYAQNVLRVSEVLAITQSDNVRCLRLLQKLGMRYQKKSKSSPDADLLEQWGIKL